MSSEIRHARSMCVAVLPFRGGGEYMEHPAYRDNLEQILKFTGGKQVLTVSQVREFTGMVDSRTIRRHFPIMKGGYISAATLARCLCGGTQK